ncbi:hypothetical protein, partial [Enhygromyxa salina]|uniref:hypothetical protein n=1 Tax=Enhygromyxa salina TaxID=215803 RepID=UPI001C62953E
MRTGVGDAVQARDHVGAGVAAGRLAGRCCSDLVIGEPGQDTATGCEGVADSVNPNDRFFARLAVISGPEGGHSVTRLLGAIAMSALAFGSGCGGDEVEAPAHIVDLVPDGRSSCVIDSRGRLRCWGAGGNDILAGGTEDDIYIWRVDD